MNMQDAAIKVENIGKRYRIGLKEDLNDSFAKSAFNFMRSPIKNYRKYRSLYNFKDIDRSKGNNSFDTIWALSDVSFEVERGEVLGIIGGNGAGKSTLLKILSRITEPTTGRAEIRGRVASLLEVGTGFHPELTGRENVYLNGTILGMRKKEIDGKFDEIVNFSGVDKFIDTPVKRYSSGMKVRLAFAVAAHLEPEILIIDEVLAVGDAAFQKKCMDKMQSVGQHGRTVLFVSHNMLAIKRLCERAILLKGGQVVMDGPSQEIVGSYINSGDGLKAERTWPDLSQAPGKDIVRLCSVRVKMEDGKVTDMIDIRKPVGIDMEYEVLKSGYTLLPHYQFYNEEGIEIFSTMENDPAWRKRPRTKGRYVSTVWIPGNLLSEGKIFVEPALITLNIRSVQFCVRDAIAFEVFDPMEGDSARGDWLGRMRGIVSPLLRWDTEYFISEYKRLSKNR